VADLLGSELRSALRKASIIAVLVIDNAEDAVPLANALLRGGVSTIELTLRTQAALDALERILKEVPEALAGAGTILNEEQVRMVKARGAHFGVSPGLNLSVVEAAEKAGLAFAPGIMTPSELEAAYEKGCKVVKLFPSEGAGGLSYLKDINGPYAHLGIEYIPLGGVSLSNLQKYLEEPSVLAVGGSWLAPRKLIQAHDWDQISRNCEEACKIASIVRA
jgi:2-dehydro-3-deoxyphosphogluconate aldolase/(4S)-4-hydroxy-2-oxoglutarate aldolase